MRRLSLGSRLGLVGSLALLTTSVALFYFIARGFSKDIAFARQERLGNEYLRPLENLLEHIPNHWAITRRQVVGDGSLAQTIEAKIDAALLELQEVDSRIGETLQFTADGLARRKREHYHWSTIRQEWESLKHVRGATLEFIDQAHAHLIADVRAMITHAGDTSNLILDPDLDSYYLMDVTLVALPQTQDRLANLEALGQDIAKVGKVNDAHRLRLATMAALLKEADIDRVTADVQTALNEDEAFNGTSPTLAPGLSPAQSEYVNANQKLLALIAATVESRDAAFDSAGFAAAVTLARQSSFRLWHAGVTELDLLLDQRISHLASERLRAVVLTAIALLLTAGIAGWVIRSTTRILSSVAAQIRGQSHEIDAASTQLSSAAQAMAAQSSKNASSLRNTSALCEAVRALAEGNRAHASSVTELSKGSEEGMSSASRSLDQMVEAIDAINSESGKISKIIRLIDEIAFQTNILALNAAVEAARAGAAGAGLAVVANEVRNLAQRCAQAARDTTALIEGSALRAKGGKAKVDEVATAIQLLIEGSSKARSIVQQMNDGSQQQTNGVAEVSRALEEMERITEGNAAGAEENAAASQRLQAQSAALKEIVEQLDHVVGGGRRLLQ